MQWQSRQGVEVVSGWRRSLPLCSMTTLWHGESEPPSC